MKIERQQTTLERGNSAGLQRASSTLQKNAPDFESMFESDDDNPTGELPEMGNLQSNLDSGMSEVLRQIIERKRASQERFRVSTDPEFFFCVVFQSRGQKEEFLRLIKWDDLGDKYINGLEVARRLGVDIQPIPIEPLKVRGKVKRFAPSDILQKGGEKE